MRIWNTFLSVTIAILLAAFPAVAAFQGTILPVSKGGTGAATLDGAGIVTKTGTQTIAGAKTLSDTATFNKTSAASTAETDIAIFKTSDAPAGSGTFVDNATSNDSAYASLWRFSASTILGNYHIFQSGTDTGSTPIGVTRWRIGTSTAVATRPLHEWQKADGTALLAALPLNSGANLALSWGAQTGAVPAYTGAAGATRSIGTRVMLSKVDGAVDADHAIGYSSGITWYSIPRANTSYKHAWYGGNGEIMALRGDGRLLTYGGRVIKIRTATTTPVTVVDGTDHVIGVRLAAPGAVAVSIPGATAAGTEFLIKDLTGDAAANNITITPASGTIDGAATLVINANYGKTRVISDGTNYYTL